MLAQSNPSHPVRTFPSERRSAPRRRVLKGAVITFNERTFSYACTLKNISDTGARLQVGDSIAIPCRFDLVVEIDGMEVSCAVAWRLKGELGVRFISAPRYSLPTRIQVLSQSNPTPPQGSLRRQPLR
jgi:hypothetical protein